MQLRPAQENDTQAIVDLVGGIYREYGFEICLEDAESDLARVKDVYPPGSFMVLVDTDETIRATVALTPCLERANVSWLKRLYLDASLRGGGHANDLLDWALTRSSALKRFRVELWSDIRFERAHRFYEKHGFRHDGTVRHMTDGYEPYDEFFFAKELDE